MKIAQLTHNYLPHIGGVEFYVKRLVDSLREKGIVPDVLTTNMDTSDIGRKDEAIYFNTTFKLMRNPLSLDLINHLRNNKYDIIHLHCVWFLPCLTAVYFRKNARVISTVHGVYPNDSNVKLRTFLRVYRPFVKYILNRSEKILVYSEIEKTKLKKFFGVDDHKIVIVPMGIEIDNYEGSQRDNVILFTGRIIPDKNPDLLIKAAARLSPVFNHYKLIFVGSIEEKYKRTLMTLSNDLDVQNEIIFAGQLDPSVEDQKNTLMNYYKKAKVFVSLGSWEGQPTRLMEAMQYETPVIAFGAGGTEDFVVNEVNGLVINTLDEKLLAKNIESILMDNTLAVRLGSEARKLITTQHSWDQTFENILSIYNTSS